MDGRMAKWLASQSWRLIRARMNWRTRRWLGSQRARGAFKIKIPRWDGQRDRLYSGFVAFTTANGARSAGGEIHYVEDMRGVAKYDEAFPRAASKKGLQVQMVDDAIALGVKHAGLNVDLPSLRGFDRTTPAIRRGNWTA